MRARMRLPILLLLVALLTPQLICADSTPETPKEAPKEASNSTQATLEAHGFSYKRDASPRYPEGQQYAQDAYKGHAGPNAGYKGPDSQPYPQYQQQQGPSYGQQKPEYKADGGYKQQEGYGSGSKPGYGAQGGYPGGPGYQAQEGYGKGPDSGYGGPGKYPEPSGKYPEPGPGKYPEPAPGKYPEPSLRKYQEMPPKEYPGKDEYPKPGYEREYPGKYPEEEFAGSKYAPVKEGYDGKYADKYAPEERYGYKGGREEKYYGKEGPEDKYYGKGSDKHYDNEDDKYYGKSSHKDKYDGKDKYSEEEKYASKGKYDEEEKYSGKGKYDEEEKYGAKSKYGDDKYSAKGKYEDEEEKYSGKDKSYEEEKYGGKGKYEGKDKSYEEEKYASKGKYGGKDKYDQEEKYGAKGKYGGKDKYDEEEQYASKGKYGGKDKYDEEEKYASKGKYGGKDKYDEEEKYASKEGPEDKYYGKGSDKHHDNEDDKYYGKSSRKDKYDGKDKYSEEEKYASKGKYDEEEEDEKYGGKDDEYKYAGKGKDDEYKYGGKGKEEGDEYSGKGDSEEEDKDSYDEEGKESEEYAEESCEKDRNCPSPQQADDVKNAYIAHGTFEWRKLSSAAGAAKAYKASHANQKVTGRVHRIKTPVLQMLAEQQMKLQSKKTTTQSSQAKSDASQYTPSAKPSSGADATKKPHPWKTESGSRAFAGIAAVDSLKHLWPSSKDETGLGFFGVRPEHVPGDQAVAVGPHPADPGAVMVIHGAQGNFNIEMVTIDKVEPVKSITSCVLSMDALMQTTGLDTSNLYGLNPSAWYDPKEKRYVLMWATALKNPDHNLPKIAYPLFVAVSHSNNPMGEWIIWALDTVPRIAPGLKFCDGQELDKYAANTPQASYSEDGIFVGMGTYCGDFSHDDGHAFLSVLYAYSKKTLYSKPGDKPCVWAAAYYGPTSWYRSVPPPAQMVIEDSFKPFNNYIQPSRPQDKEDVTDKPMFVMKVSDTLMSIATLTGEPLEKMDSKDTAPKIIATMVGKGADFANKDASMEGIPAMPQPESYRTLDAGDVGTMNRTSELRAYWAQHHENVLYLTTSEYWGSGHIRMPSLYWSILKPGAGLCTAQRLCWGVLASQDGLALAYPVIAAAKEEDEAVMAFAYSGAGTISDSKYPAYPGVATAVVGEKGEGTIQIVKRGTAIIDRSDLPDPQSWGTYSAGQVFAGRLWFAVSIPEEVNQDDGTTVVKHGSWVGAVSLSDYKY